MTNKIPDQQAFQAHHATIRATSRTIACVICQALYALAPAHSYLLEASPLAFESAFISMCRFCFRCRRPACPECWDHIHGVCGQCTLESQLPFRTEVAPLPGVLLKLPEREQAALSIGIPERRFVCIYPGRFQPENERTIAELATRPSRGRRQPQQATSTATKTLPQLSISKGLDIDDIITQPDLTITFEAQSQQVRKQQTQPKRHTQSRQVHTAPAQADQPHSSIRNIIENIGINLLLLLLICILLLIIAAEVSPSTNALLTTFLHINIRAEITYLLQLINHLHF